MTCTECQQAQELRTRVTRLESEVDYWRNQYYSLLAGMRSSGEEST
jgi:hypothetical protein